MFKKGEPRPAKAGRKKGSQNKTTIEAKEAIAKVFNDLGGDEALAKWASSDPDNMKVFYATIWPKIIPLQVNGTHDVNHHDDEARRDAEERADRLMRQLAILGGAPAMPDELGLSVGVRTASERLQ